MTMRTHYEYVLVHDTETNTWNRELISYETEVNTDADGQPMTPGQIMNAELGARRYAQADRSDPNAYRRAISHIRNGICNKVHRGKNDDGGGQCYDAKEHWEMRTLPEGLVFSNGDSKYQAQVWHSVQRP